MNHKEDCTCPICQIPRLEKTIAEQAEQIRQLINLVALAEGRDTKQTEQISKLRAELVIEKSNRKIAEANRTLFQNTALKYQETQTAQICKLQAENARLKAEKLQQAEQIERLKELCQKARDHCSFGLYAEGSLVRKNNVQEALRLLEQALAAQPQGGSDE